MMRNSMESPELLDALEKLDEPAGDTLLSSEQNERICRMALKKTGCQPAAEKTGREHVSMDTRSHKRRTAGRTLRIGLIAAAILCASAATAFAAGPQLMEMLSQRIGFFTDAPSQQTVENPVEAPRGSYTQTQQKLEAFNASVGQSVTDNGVTVTLDTISMDVSSMDIFLTITGEEAIQKIKDIDDYGPLWNKFFGSGPNFYSAKINGREIAQPDVEDWYLAEDGSLKLWRHYILTALPEGDEIKVELNETSHALGCPGRWCFTVTLDGKSVRASGKTAKPDTYPMPAVTYENVDGFGSSFTLNKDLGLTYLAFGPKGGVIQTAVTEKKLTTKDGSEMYTYEGMDANMLYITDNTGKELYTSKFSGIGGDAANLTAPDPSATALTLTPVRYTFANEDGSTSETRTITTEELKNGAKVETSQYGGYIVKNFSIQKGVICYDLVPYGWNPQSQEVLRPQDDGLISMVSEEATDLQTGETATLLHSALLSSTIDPQTGIISVRHDYYAATDEELESITQWEYDYFQAEMDTEHAITVQLESLTE